MPGTSVQISTRRASSSAPKYAAEVSEPPRPRIAVPPSPWRAMKPWLTSTSPGCAAKRARIAGSGSKRQFTDRRRAHSLALGSEIASNQSRASHQPQSSPCERR